MRGEEGLGGWLVKPAEWYGDNRVELRTGVTIQGVDTRLKKVTLEGEETVEYDKLLLCTGGRNRRLQVPGAETPGVYQLRTLAECDAIRRAAHPGARALVVGMGFIGSEVAASLRQLGLEVTAVLNGVAPLTAVLGSQVAEVIARIHRNHGVQLVTEDRVVGFEGSDHLAGAITAKGARIDCDLAVVAIGIEPAIDAFKGSEIELDNGILVDETCRTSAPDVFAAGDVANHLHPVFGRMRVEHYNNAEKQGRAAARAMLGDQRPYDDIHSFWSDQYEDKLEYVGDARSWDQIVIRGSLAKES
jgi:3-phenylpropionate/trans-cinnamate dioxygenase ferredoxin reductase subunit